VPYRRKKLTFAISSPDEFLLLYSDAVSARSDSTVQQQQFIIVIHWLLELDSDTSTTGVALGKGYAILRLAILLQYWLVMDRQTYDDSIYHASSPTKHCIRCIGLLYYT